VGPIMKSIAAILLCLLAACGGGDEPNNCPELYQWAESRQQCVRCPPGFVWNNHTGKCGGGAQAL
jgi:predicted homoserine dehydrogenase-like protein